MGDGNKTFRDDQGNSIAAKLAIVNQLLITEVFNQTLKTMKREERKGNYYAFPTEDENSVPWFEHLEYAEYRIRKTVDVLNANSGNCILLSADGTFTVDSDLVAATMLDCVPGIFGIHKVDQLKSGDENVGSPVLVAYGKSEIPVDIFFKQDIIQSLESWIDRFNERDEKELTELSAMIGSRIERYYSIYPELMPQYLAELRRQLSRKVEDIDQYELEDVADQVVICSTEIQEDLQRFFLDDPREGDMLTGSTQFTRISLA